FYDNLLPKLFVLIDKPPDADTARFILREAEIGGKPTLFRDKKCAPKDVTTVKPWWNTQSTVRICKDDYRPTVTTENVINGQPTFCEAPEAFVEGSTPKCGCGPYLVNCARDAAQGDALSRAYRDEVIRTIQLVIQTRRPFSDILLMNETVRSDLGDYFYAR